MKPVLLTARGLNNLLAKNKRKVSNIQIPLYLYEFIKATDRGFLSSDKKTFKNIPLKITNNKTELRFN